MKINSYQIGMDSARTYSSGTTRKFTLSYAKTDSFESFENLNGSRGDSQYSAMDAFENLKTTSSKRIEEVNSKNTVKTIDEFRSRFIQYLWESLFGHKRAGAINDRFAPYQECYPDDSMSSAQGNSFSTIEIHGISEYSFHETENVSFKSGGTVTCEDGRTIDFNIDIEMSRSFSEFYRSEVTEIANMCDPLVLNFTGDVADLTDQKYYFDLDSDGQADEISMLSEGNGFLALDKNNDGTINDGSELFGTSSGDGFKDLAEYDSDGNGWIDENDEIFDSLKIWVKDASGNDALYSLRDKNVGAIYLGNSNTNFGLRSGETGQLNGAIRKTGVFLFEDGSGVGTMSHLDIAN